MKRCSKCKRELEDSCFQRASNQPRGLSCACRECKQAEYRANREAILAQKKVYHQEHREERRAYKQSRKPRNNELMRKWRAEHPEQWKEMMARSRAKNREKLLASKRAYYHERGGKEYSKAYLAQWRKENPDRWLGYMHTRRARKAHNGGSFTAAEWEALKARYNYTCLCCGKREPRVKLGPDHVIPISKGGTSWISNIQPLCFPCNNSKHDNTTDYRPKERPQQSAFLWPGMD